jgi:hypothetical protein
MKYEVSKKITHNKRLPFLLRYSCHPWAQACYFVSERSLQSSSKLPLPPFVALSNFLIGQHPSLLANPFSTDSTIRLLFSIATRVCQEQISEGENQMKDILQVCEETDNTMAKAISTLLEEIPDVMMWSRTKNILENGKLLPQAHKQKYEEVLHSNNSIDNHADTTDNYTSTNTTNKKLGIIMFYVLYSVTHSSHLADTGIKGSRGGAQEKFPAIGNKGRRCSQLS